MIPKKIYIRELDIDIFNNEVSVTRAWVANKPCTGRREYADLSQVWHPAEEEPQVGRQVLGIDYDGEAGSGVFEFRSVAGIFIYGDLILDWDSVVHWAYIEDLLPKKK